MVFYLHGSVCARMFVGFFYSNIGRRRVFIGKMQV